jgi:MFS family permease
VLASLFILGGSLGDRFGRKPVFVGGMFIFDASSPLSSFATNPAQLVAARVFQAIGGSMFNPVAMGIVTGRRSDRHGLGVAH